MALRRLFGGEKLKCVGCKKEFKTMDALKGHFTSSPTCSPNHCGRCLTVFDTPGQLLSHQKTCLPGDSAKCVVCKKVFPSGAELADHLAQSTHCKAKSSACFSCGAVFKSRPALFAHIDANPACKIGKPSPKTAGGDGMCTTCGRKFPSKAFVFPHLNSHPECRYARVLADAASTVGRSVGHGNTLVRVVFDDGLGLDTPAFRCTSSFVGGHTASVDSDAVTVDLFSNVVPTTVHEALIVDTVMERALGDAVPAGVDRLEVIVITSSKHAFDNTRGFATCSALTAAMASQTVPSYLSVILIAPEKAFYDYLQSVVSQSKGYVYLVTHNRNAIDTVFKVLSAAMHTRQCPDPVVNEP
jgi:hypothetical protein